MTDNRPEWYDKFQVIRRSTGEEETGLRFTMLPEEDPHAAVALRAYADSVETDAPGLAAAIRATLAENGL